MNPGAQSRWIASNYPGAIAAFNHPKHGYRDSAGKPSPRDEKGNIIQQEPLQSNAYGGRVKVLKAGGRIGALSGLFR